MAAQGSKMQLQQRAPAQMAAAAAPPPPQLGGDRRRRSPPAALPCRRARRADALIAAAAGRGATRQAERQAAAAPPAPSHDKAAAAAEAAMVDAAESESLALLEWPALCRQVACFAQTPMGAEVAARCALPLGRSQAESEQLLRETAEAQEAQLDFRGAYDVRQAVAAAEQGRVLHPLVLGAVATTLEAAQRLLQALQAAGSGDGSHAAARPGGGRFPALQRLAAGIGAALPKLREAIERCIQPREGRILDEASPALGEVRAARRANRAALRAEMDRWARELHRAGVSERAQVVVRRERLCVPVRRGRQGELPKGSVTLAASESGSTLYMEPQPAVALNNAETALAGREAAEEQAVLVELSGLVAQHAQQLHSVLASITALDVAAARGRHGAWLGATAPPRFLSPAEAAEGGPVRLPRAWHPLLLQPCLPPLPSPPLPEELQQQQLEDQALSGPLAGLALVPELAMAASPRPAGEVGSSAPRRGKGAAAAGASDDGSSGGGGSSPAARWPQPVDLLVPPGVSVVAVTGPNTGGKTASLKALGLQALMAKAGLFLPQAPPPGQPHATAQQQGQQGQQQQAQALLWFDRVLADLGDGQSLQQSLSTFSGHVRRIRNVLAAATPQSLVLLDEVGSGTDPGEGAALAAALLERLHRQAALTYATTHHAELKELAATTPSFVNASVEFDVASLRPTYRLLWGAAGESNALAVAQGLGFAPALVAAAREVAAELHHSSQTAGQRSAALQASLLDQLGEARAAASAAAAARAQAEASLAAAQRELREVQERQEGVKKAAGRARSAADEAQQRVQRLLADVRAGRLSSRQAEEALRQEERAAAPPDDAAMRLMGLRAAAKGGASGLADDSSSSAQAAPEGWAPAVGDTVRVLKMGGAAGVVVSAGGRSGGKVGVRVGSMTVELRLSDLAPAGGPAGTARKAAAGGKSGSLKAAAKQLRRKGVLSSGDEGDGGNGAAASWVAVQTSRNTCDVRGMQAAEAAAEVQAAVLSAPNGFALYVVHGVGTGRVRDACLKVLRRLPQVAKLEEAEGSNGGCTIAFLK